MMKFTIERKSSLERSGAQNLAQRQKSLHVHPANTFEAAFYFHSRVTAVEKLTTCIVVTTLYRPHIVSFTYAHILKRPCTIRTSFLSPTQFYSATGDVVKDFHNNIQVRILYIYRHVNTHGLRYPVSIHVCMEQHHSPDSIATAVKTS